MKNKTKTTLQSHDKHPIVCSDCTPASAIAQEVKQTAENFRTALLIVSLCVNVFSLITWLVIQHSSVYAAQIMSLLQN